MNQCGQIMDADQQISRPQDRKIQIVNKFEKPKYQNVLDFLDYLEDRPGAVLRENNSENIPAPPTENPNRVKPDAKNASNVWTGLFDDPVPTPSTDQDTNISLDNPGFAANAVPHLQENNPEAVPVSPNQNSNNEALETNVTNESLNGTSENTENVSYATGAETETEVSSANPNAVKPSDSIVFSKWGSTTIDVPSTSTAKYNGTINVDISVDERYLIVVNGNAPKVDYPQQELITSEESQIPKETRTPEEALTSEETKTSKETLTPEDTLTSETLTTEETP